MILIRPPAATVVVPGPDRRPPSQSPRPVTVTLPVSLPARCATVPASVSASPAFTVMSSAISLKPVSWTAR